MIKKTIAEIKERKRKYNAIYNLEYSKRPGVRERRIEQSRRFRLKHGEKLNRKRRTPKHRAKERLRCQTPEVRARKSMARKKNYYKTKLANGK